MKYSILKGLKMEAISGESVDPKTKNYTTLSISEEQHLASLSVKTEKSTKNGKDSKRVRKVSKASSKATTLATQEPVNTVTVINTSISLNKNDEGKYVVENEENLTLSKTDVNQSSENFETLEIIRNKKSKSRKMKKNASTEENISVKSSFSKFDALQKKNLLHNPQETEANCRLCSKPVYKMEEIKAEKSIFHKACFRCNECGKHLKVDSYQSHEGILFCIIHFKLLLAPKCQENSELEISRKPELIIRENQPAELPPDVVRASDKPNLGLEELQQLNVRSKFQVFEKFKNCDHEASVEQNVTLNPKVGVKRNISILTKLAKLEAHGFNTGDILSHISAQNILDTDKDDNSSNDDTMNNFVNADDENSLSDEIKIKSSSRESPIGISEETMKDIKSKFEKGLMSKEERREERKQELQNIRSRLFMGKQAKIKEMYQQAVADSEQSITSVGKASDVDFGSQATRLKVRFENGEIYKSTDSEVKGSSNIKQEDVEVFEYAISKNSRNIFKDLEAVSVSNAQSYTQLSEKPSQHSKDVFTKKDNFEANKRSEIQQDVTNVVKYNEEQEDVEIKTSEISEKFKFFETYQPKDGTRKEFRITPPREGVVKMPQNIEENDEIELSNQDVDINILAKSHTTSKMLNKFREMEQNKNMVSDVGLRPLKSFTPPPDSGHRFYEKDDESDYSPDDDYDDGEDGTDYENKEKNITDEALIQAKAAARAKILRAKFEKWEANEIQREKDEGFHMVDFSNTTDDTIESTRNIRERFENMRNSGTGTITKPRYKVNRFI